MRCSFTEKQIIYFSERYYYCQGSGQIPPESGDVPWCQPAEVCQCYHYQAYIPPCFQRGGGASYTIGFGNFSQCEDLSR